MAGFPTYQSTQLANSTSNSVAPSKPASLAAGDLMLAQVVANGSTTSISAPAGWTKIADSYSTGRGMATFYKVADANDVAASTFTFSADNASSMKAALSRFNLMDATTPIAGATTITNDFSGSPSVSGFTPTLGNGLYLILVGWAGDGNAHTVDSYAIATDNPTWTEAYDSDSSGHNGVAMAYANRGKMTATGNASASIETAISGGFDFIQLIELAPVAIKPLTLGGTLGLPAMPLTITSAFALGGTLGTPSIAIGEPLWIADSRHAADWIADTRP